MMAAVSGTLLEEIVDFLAASPSAEEIVAFRPSATLQGRASYLLEQNRNQLLSPEERTELDEFSRMNQFMSLLKVRVRR